MKHNPNITTLAELAPVLRTLQGEGKKIVLCHGVFDLLHIGHIRYLRQAKEMGDVLVVTITPDQFVDKGPHRPAFNEQLRLEAVASLDSVDYAALNMWPTAEETLRQLRPDIYAKGSEFKKLSDITGKITREAAVAAEIGCELYFVEDIVFSSSSLINRHLSPFSQETRQYLAQFRQRYALQDILDRLDGFRNLRALVVGDMILDEYIYSSTLGASSKDPVLALLYHSRELFAGGAAAVANHVAQHVAGVTLCTLFGDDGHEDFVRERLAPNVNLVPVIRQGSPTVRKQRIVDRPSLQKQFEIYNMETTALSQETEDRLLEEVARRLPEHDLVLVADFGHGCISPALVELLCAKAPFLAVNTQANAGNRGYHTISRYRKADFVSLARHEISLEFRNVTLTTGEMMAELRDRMDCRTVIVTEGSQGCAALRKSEFQRAPAFAANIVDKVGAGDALFAVTALAAFMEHPLDIVAFLGNITGSLAVETMGNAKAVGRDAMSKFITSILK